MIGVFFLEPEFHPATEQKLTMSSEPVHCYGHPGRGHEGDIMGAHLANATEKTRL